MGHVGAGPGRQIAAARARDVAGFVRTTANARRLSRQINATASALGLSKASCEQVFG